VHRRGNSTDAAVDVQGTLRKRQCTNSTIGNGPHVMTQVDRLHAKGITGKGVKIAVIDSGVSRRLAPDISMVGGG
jgi:subtilisin family serine protease